MGHLNGGRKRMLQNAKSEVQGPSLWNTGKDKPLKKTRAMCFIHVKGAELSSQTYRM